VIGFHIGLGNFFLKMHEKKLNSENI
jgi:hypothetical protein